MAFANLEEQFRKKMEELYSSREHPAKDSADLHPLIEVRPNDRDRPQGTAEASRLYPVPHVLTDQERMTKWLTSPTGLRWILSQEVLQTGNAISETRLINPLFVNLNLTPTEHFKRHLFDQQDTIITSPDRSPASTPQIGAAGRLQIETANTATARLLNRPSFGNSIVSFVKSLQIASPIKSLVGAAIGEEGTLGVNQRPEFDVYDGKDYYTVQYEGVDLIFDNQMAKVAAAFEFVGGVASTVGLPNLFSGLRTPASSPVRNTLEAKRVRSWMPYYAAVGKTYLNNGFTPDVMRKFGGALPLKSLVPIIPDAVLQAGKDVANFVDEQIQKVVSTGAGRTVSSALNVIGIGAPTPVSTAIQISKKANTGVTPKKASSLSIEDQLSDVAKERSIRRMFEKAEPSKKLDESLPPGAQELKRLAQQESMEKWNQIRREIIESGKNLKGVIGGITINQTVSPTEGGSVDDAPITSVVDDDTKDTFFTTTGVSFGVGGPEIARYYVDAINFPSSIVQGTVGGERAVPPDDFPDDYVKFRILDFSNNRLLTFRAIIQTIVETHTPEFVENKYIGRVERNIVYSGNVRTVLVTFYVHAFSEPELSNVWHKMNYLTGLTFPGRYSNRGYIIPPICELTIGDMYVNQPGYISAYDVTASAKVGRVYGYPIT